MSVERQAMSVEQQAMSGHRLPFDDLCVGSKRGLRRLFSPAKSRDFYMIFIIFVFIFALPTLVRSLP